MTDLSIRVDAAAAIGLMGRISDNYPKARTLALNRVAQEVNGQLQREARARMTIRDARGWRMLNDYAPLQLFAAQRARDDKPWATAVNPQNAGKILRPFETGGWKTTDRFGSVPFLPTEHVRPTRQAVIPKSKFPSSLFPDKFGNYSINKDAKTWNKGKGTRGRSFQKMKPFILKPGRNPNTWGIWQRFGKGRNDLRMLWAFRPIIRKPDLLDTYGTAKRVVGEQWAPMMAGAFNSIVRGGQGRASLLDLTV